MQPTCLTMPLSRPPLQAQTLPFSLHPRRHPEVWPCDIGIVEWVEAERELQRSSVVPPSATLARSATPALAAKGECEEHHPLHTPAPTPTAFIPTLEVDASPRPWPHPSLLGGRTEGCSLLLGCWCACTCLALTTPNHKPSLGCCGDSEAVGGAGKPPLKVALGR